MAPDRRRRNRITVLALLGIVSFMVGLDIASVPLYRLFCAVTGYNGTTQRAEEAPATELKNAVVTVRFDANVSPELGWEFQAPAPVRLHPGEERTVAYRAVNKSGEPLTGTATYNVTPAKVGIYFDKIQCFCFTEQTLKPGETAELPVSFFVDPAILQDRNLDDVDTITLSYTFLRSLDDAAKSGLLAKAGPHVGPVVR